MKTEELQRRFRDRCRTIHDLESAQGLLDWDHQVMMPPGGGEQRSHQLAALAVIIHEKVKDPALGELMDDLARLPDLAPGLLADLREMRRAMERAVKIPQELVAERTRVCAQAQPAWEKARAEADFGIFLPHLERVISLSREVASALSDGDPFDVLLDDFEPGMTRAVISPLFDDLGGRLRTLLDRIRGSSAEPPDADLTGRPCPVEQQEAFILQIIRDMGFDMEAGRVDRSTHPFTAGTFRDVRITTRYDQDRPLVSLFGLIHETGHALYEQGLDPERYRDPAGGYCSLGIHESQSRLWENLIGRSRPFWEHYLPRLQAAIPGPMDDVDLDRFYRAINAVAPTMIRVDADEVTYNLHIILRFNLEVALLTGDLPPAEVPSAWGEEMDRLLGVHPPDDRDGALQDIHWAAGFIGYFPTYTLGNLFAAQLMETIRREIPDLDRRIASGDLLVVKRWLNETVHRGGQIHLAPDLCQRVTGSPLGIEAAMRHLEVKYADIYRL